MFKSFFFVICAFGKPGLILTSIKKVFRISYNKFLSMMGFLYMQSPLDKKFLKQNWTSLKIVGKKTFTHILHVLMVSFHKKCLCSL